MPNIRAALIRGSRGSGASADGWADGTVWKRCGTRCKVEVVLSSSSHIRPILNGINALMGLLQVERVPNKAACATEDVNVLSCVF